VPPNAKAPSLQPVHAQLFEHNCAEVGEGLKPVPPKPVKFTKTGVVQSLKSKFGQVQRTGAVVSVALVLVQLVVVFLHLANTVNGVVVYVGTVVLHGPPALVAHSNTVPAPHPVAEIVPVVDGQTLFTMVIVGCVGVVHVPGTVVTAADIGLEMVLSISQLHLVSML
jgi:hypothetical protein